MFAVLLSHCSYLCILLALTRVAHGRSITIYLRHTDQFEVRGVLREVLNRLPVHVEKSLPDQECTSRKSFPEHLFSEYKQDTYIHLSEVEEKDIFPQEKKKQGNNSSEDVYSERSHVSKSLQHNHNKSRLHKSDALVVPEITTSDINDKIKGLKYRNGFKEFNDDLMTLDKMPQARHGQQNNQRRLTFLDGVDKMGNKSQNNMASRRTRSADELWQSQAYGIGNQGTVEADMLIWQEVSDEELAKAKKQKYLEVAKYVGITLVSVIGFTCVAYFFVRDPSGFVMACGMGCPCCVFLCPCLRNFVDKYLNPDRIIKESMNKYMPGMFVKEDGTVETYEPTDEEIMRLAELMDELMCV